MVLLPAYVFRYGVAARMRTAIRALLRKRLCALSAFIYSGFSCTTIAYRFKFDVIRWRRCRRPVAFFTAGTKQFLISQIQYPPQLSYLFNGHQQILLTIGNDPVLLLQ